MRNTFLAREYVALALIKTAKKHFHKDFITRSELNQFEVFLQQEFNDRQLNVIIKSDPLSSDDFIMLNDVIMTSHNCSFSLSLLPLDILTVLEDSNLIVNFLTQLESVNREENNKELVKKNYIGLALCGV